MTEHERICYTVSSVDSEKEQARRFFKERFPVYGVNVGTGGQTMNDLISRQPLLAKIRKIEEEPDYLHKGEDWTVGLTIAERLIEIAELAYPKKGKWTKISPANIYECSVCHQNVMTKDIEEYHYCPNCGADMRESE